MLNQQTEWPRALELSRSSSGNSSQIICEKALRSISSKRLTCLGSWDGITVVIKLFLDKRRAAKHQQRELSGLKAFQQAGIKTPLLLYEGALNDQTPVLIFEYLDRSKTAAETWLQASNDAERRHCLMAIADLLIQHHDNGIYQQDLHLDNFLCYQSHWYSIDGDSVITTSKSSLIRSIDNMALLLAQLEPQFDPVGTEILNYYCDQRKLNDKTVETQILRKRDKKRTQRRQKYIKKCYRNCTEFVRRDNSDQIAIYRREIDSDLIQRLIDNPDKLMESGDMLKDGNSATVKHIHHPDGDWVIKRYNIKNRWHFIKRCLRPSRAWVSWGNAQRLTISGIRTPQPIALIEKRLGPLRSTAYYICKHTAGEDALSFFTNNQLESVMTAANGMVEIFKSFYKLGIHHGDCKATNFLIANQEPWVIDLDAMYEPRTNSSFLKCYKKDRQRFLKNWFSQVDQSIYNFFKQNLP